MRVLKGLSMLAAIAAFSVNEASATIVVDAFTVSQITTQGGVGSKTTTASGAGIFGGTRTQTVSLDSLPPFAVGVASSGNPSGVFTGSLTGPNNPVGGSFFDLSYSSSTPVDALTGNLGFYFTASSQGGSTITIIANGTSSATINVPDGAGFNTYFVAFGAFSNNAVANVFPILSSIEIKATFPNVTGSGPSLTFTGPIVISAIPEPSVMALASIAGLALGGLRLRRKS